MPPRLQTFWIQPCIPTTHSYIMSTPSTPPPPHTHTHTAPTKQKDSDKIHNVPLYMGTVRTLISPHRREIVFSLDNIYTIQNLHIANSVDLDQPTHPQNLIWFCISHPGTSFMCKLYREEKRGGVGARSQNRDPFYSDTYVNELNKCKKKLKL